MDLAPDDASFVYDEMSLFHENCEEYGLTCPDPVPVQRVTLGSGGELSGLRWGDGTPGIVFLHGGAQNSHTWDTVLLAMGCPPAICIDLPGHGHSRHRTDGRYDPRTNAATIASALEGVVHDAVLLVGMSLGGLTANALAASRPDLVRRMVVIDVTPGVDRDKAKEIHDFIAGPQRFESFAAIFERTVQFNPTRTASSLRRGILHNAHRLPDGSWEWNYDRSHIAEEMPSMAELWADIAAIQCPYVLAKGTASPVVGPEDVEELLRLRPDAVVVPFEGAGHSIQGDQPLELAALLSDQLAQRI
jgi:esterase